MMAMEALRSLWVSSCALAVEPRAEARTQPNVSAPERSEDRNILLLPNCRHGDRRVRKYSGTLAIKGRSRAFGGVGWRVITQNIGRGSRQICCDAQQASPPDVIASVRPESQQEGKPHETARVHHAARRRCRRVAARGGGAAAQLSTPDRRKGCGNGRRGRKFLNSQHRYRASSVPMYGPNKVMDAADTADGARGVDKPTAPAARRTGSRARIRRHRR